MRAASKIRITNARNGMPTTVKMHIKLKAARITPLTAPRDKLFLQDSSCRPLIHFSALLLPVSLISTGMMISNRLPPSCKIHKPAIIPPPISRLFCVPVSKVKL
ncbi:hypothetical protein D3C75_1233340 [compost metagenome]